MAARGQVPPGHAGLSVNLMLAWGARAGQDECDSLSWLLPLGDADGGGSQGSLMLVFTPDVNILRGLSQLARWPSQIHLTPRVPVLCPRVSFPPLSPYPH